jgi:stress response protein YsnF
MTETDEEAVVAKTARVVEEVVVSKDVTERVETIRDTVRRDEVEIEKIPGGKTTTSSTTSATTTPPRTPKI